MIALVLLQIFSHTTRLMDKDMRRGWTGWFFLTLMLIVLWAFWFFTVEVSLYEVSGNARLEVKEAVHLIQSPVEGRVVSSRLSLGKKVKTGDVLVELDTETERLRRKEALSRQEALATQADALARECKALEEAIEKEAGAHTLILEEARQEAEEAKAQTEFSKEEARRMSKLRSSGAISDINVLKAQTEARKFEAKAKRLALAVDRLQSEQEVKKKNRQLELAELKGEQARISGELSITRATVERLDYEIDRRRLKAPVDGYLGETEEIRIGSYVEEGHKLASVVPQGRLRLIAYFDPGQALGKVQPGQEAWLRLKGFPWTQYGVVSATVLRVASEPTEEKVRVELMVHAAPDGVIPLEHGLPGAVEIQVDKVTPATLVLRVAGKLLHPS